MATDFDVSRFKTSQDASRQYERQLRRLRDARQQVDCIEHAVRGALENVRAGNRSFVIYGEPQSGKTEMMICLTAKLLDEGKSFILHLLNDSVELLGQNLDRFQQSGLSPSAKHYSEILDPEFKISGRTHVVFCKKNAKDLQKLTSKIGHLKDLIIIDDEADFASPNSKVNRGTKTRINELISNLLSHHGTYIGVTATPARLDLNNTFDNDTEHWVHFPPHNLYTGQDLFFPVDAAPKYFLTLLPDHGSDPKFSREALFRFMVGTAYLNRYVNEAPQNYSILVHTSGKKIDHKGDWSTIEATLAALVDRSSKNFNSYAEQIWRIASSRYPDADADDLTHYILDNSASHKIVVLNSERDRSANTGSATSPSSLFTVIIGGNIVSRGVTFNNLLSMYFTRDVRHKIQQDTYIQRARMFGARGKYLRFFELTIPDSLFADWHRCFVFHKLALAAITQGEGSPVWLGDNRISAVASASVDKASVDLDRGEMQFQRFSYDESIERIVSDELTVFAKMEEIARLIGEAAFPDYVRRYIRIICPFGEDSIAIHSSSSIDGYKSEPGLDKERIERRKGLMGANQLQKKKYPRAIHHLKIFYNAQGRARLYYKFEGSIQFIKNLKNAA